MKNITKILGCLVWASLFVGCQSNETEAESAASSRESEMKTEQANRKNNMYQPSELAQLMRQMYDDNLELKAMVERGEIPKSFPEDFYRIHSAEATDPKDKNETYHALAEKYLQDLEDIKKADEHTVKEAFNGMVNTCISCHTVFCQGPIPRIKKLMVE